MLPLLLELFALRAEGPGRVVLDSGGAHSLNVGRVGSMLGSVVGDEVMDADGDDVMDAIGCVDD